jgi:hypothetical protein
MNYQIVHDSIHRRAGGPNTYALSLNDTVAGFGLVAIGGPWTGKPTILEFYIAPAHRGHAFQLFELFLETSGARLMEAQANDRLLAVMLHAYARDVFSEKIVFSPGRYRATAGANRMAASAGGGNCCRRRASCRTRPFSLLTFRRRNGAIVGRGWTRPTAWGPGATPQTRSHLTNSRYRTQHPRRQLDRSTLATTPFLARRMHCDGGRGAAGLCSPLLT